MREVADGGDDDQARIGEPQPALGGRGARVSRSAVTSKVGAETAGANSATSCEIEAWNASSSTRRSAKPAK